MHAAVGFSTHSGWAVAITAGLDDEGHLRVVDRRRVELVDAGVPRQAYHAAAAVAPGDAAALVGRVDASIEACASVALGGLVATARDVIAGVAVVGAAREIPDVAVVLANHALMHGSEGEQYRRGIVAAANELGLPVLRISPAALVDRVAELLGWTPERTAGELAAVGAAIGPPWQSDHKQAALAAMTALAAPRPARGGRHR